MTIHLSQDGKTMIDVGRVLELHETTVELWHGEEIANPHNGIWQLICQQHEFNFRLWHEEDTARCPNASDSEIANVKRAIDKLNQNRNDWIEKVDVWIEDELANQGVAVAADARLNTETPGSAIDRLSILALRLYHLEEQLDRADADMEHLNSVGKKICIAQMQRENLATSLSELLADIGEGRKRHQTYRQMKMYNDPSLNPVLIAAGKVG